MLIHGDMLEEVDKLDENSMDSCVTDPPYHLESIVKRFGKGQKAAKGEGAAQRLSKGFMGQQWDGGDIAFRKETWEKVYRVLKPGGLMVAFAAPRNDHRMAVAIEDAGFICRDKLLYLFGSGFPKALDISKAIDKHLGEESDAARQWEGWKSPSLKPAYETILLFQKPLDGTYAQNTLKWGVGGVNIDACRIGETGARNNGKAASTSQSLGDHGTERVDYGKGRFPSNVLFDEEAAKLLPSAPGQQAPSRGDGAPMHNDIYGAMKHQNTSFLPRDDGDNESASRFFKVTKADNPSGGFWQPSTGKPCGPVYHDDGEVSRFFYTSKAQQDDRNEGLEDFEAERVADRVKEDGVGGDNPRNRSNKAKKNIHPAVKPCDLMIWLCKLITPPGGTILDPFMGSGSTGKAARIVGFDFIGIEKDEKYFKIAEARIKFGDPEQFDLR